jgi:hypothetical protein
MQRRWIITAGLVITAALGLPPGSGASAKGVGTKKLTCTLQLYAQGAPNPSGIHFGFASCPRPFGRGVQHNAYTVTPTSPGHGTVSGRFRNYYDRGSTRGSFALTFTATTMHDLTYTGTVTYTGGTGAFAHVKGHGTIVCTTSDGGAHKSCTVKSTLTGV